MTHTETPWHLDEIDKGRAFHILGKPNGFCADIVATISVDFDCDEANARHIVHCVNTHDDLVKALEGCIPSGVCLTNSNIPDDTIVPIDATMGELRAVAAALSKAKGGAA